MTRRLVNPPTATRVAGDFILRPVELPGREFVTLQAPWPVRGRRRSVHDRFVRITPKEGATEADVDDVARWCQADGCLGIKRLPIPRPNLISADKAREVIDALDDLSGEHHNTTVTNVVLELVEQSTLDPSLKPLLLQYCKDTLEDSDVPDDD